MDDGSLELNMRQQSVHYRLVPLADQRRWIATGEAIGGGLLALAHGLEVVVGWLTRNNRPHAAPLPPSAVVAITSRGRRPGSPSPARRIHNPGPHRAQHRDAALSGKRGVGR